MRLFDAIGPNPRVVRMFVAEKGLDIATTVMVLGTGATTTPEHLARNPRGEVPVLQVDDGACISESLAICEYLEEIHPEPPLYGVTPEQRAQVRMWARRIDLGVNEPIMNAFRMSRAGWRRFAGRVPLAPAGAAALREVARRNLAWADGHLGDNEYLCGERFTAADILLFIGLSYGIEVGQAIESNWVDLRRWFDLVSQRSSAESSLYSQVNLKEISGSI